MPCQTFPRFQQTATADGTADGYFTCDDNTGFEITAYAWLRGNGGDPAPQLCRITELISTNMVGLVFVPTGITDPKWRNSQIPFPDYGRTNLSIYAVGSVLFQYEQVLRTDGLP